MRQVQIPYSVFLDLIRYFYANQRDEHTERRLRKAIGEKVAKIANRERYGKAMLSQDEQEREQLLEEYYKYKHGR